MTKAQDIMTSEVRGVGPSDSLQVAATLMKQLDVGSLPVMSGERLLGMLTDRDITIRGVASGLAPALTQVADVMTPDPQVCGPDDAIEDLMRRMGRLQLRRLPVVHDGRVVGMVSQADLARQHQVHIDPYVRAVSEPAPGDEQALQMKDGPT